MGDPAGFLSAIDRTVFLTINRTLQNAAFDHLMPILSDKWLGFTLAAVVVPWWIFRSGRRAWPVIVVAVLALALSDLGAGAIKHAAQRIRPCHVIAEAHLLAGCTRSFAMPSNHASNMFAIAGVVATLWPSWRWVMFSLAAGVAYSRVYLGVHYPSDVLVGAVWGAAIGWGLALAARRIVPTTWAAGRAGKATAPAPRSADDADA